MNRDILDAALARAALGIPVFPLAANKRPACEGGFKAASTDPETIARMFADPRAALIGIPTGAVSGFDVLDIDVRNGGLEWWEANKHRIPPARIQHTRSGGLHIPFRHAAGLRNSASKIAPGVDVRADGGYVADWDSAGLHAEGTGWPEWPAELLIDAMRGQHDPNSAAPAPAELAPPSAADLIALLHDMPNPVEVTRGEYVALNLAVAGAIRALESLGRCDGAEADEIRDAAADWSARWDSVTAADFESERRRWDSDWSTRTNDVSGWRHILGLAERLGVDVSRHRVAAAVAEFGPVLEDQDACPASSVFEPPGDPAWKSKLHQKRGEPVANLANILFALRRAPEWQGVLRFDTFASRVTISRPPPFGTAAGIPRVVQDADLTLTAEWFQNEGVNASLDSCAHAVAAVARESSFSPLCDYLESVRHDGAARIDTWLIDHLGAADTPLNRAVGARFLIAAVARAFQPGCQVDTMLVLEGRQGLRKSTALRVLFGSDWFTDHIPDLHNKDAAMQIQGVWLLEHAEMATLNRTDAARVKEFVSRRIDRFRPPYGKLTADHPRQCVFAATLNPGGSGYLKDETGARRFWPVECGVAWPEGQRIDADALAAVRDQIWAEAVARYRSGEVWWLDNPQLEAAQVEATDARYDADVWTDDIARFVAGRPAVNVSEVFEALNIPARDRSRAFQMRIGGVLRSLGWRHRRQLIEGCRAWVYVPPPGAVINLSAERARRASISNADIAPLV